MIQTSPTRRALLIVALGVFLLVAVLASIAFGVRSVPFEDAWQALLGHNTNTNQAAATVRLPRTLLAAIVGACLAIAGTTMQAVTRNPLADPGIFGVLSGAALAVVIGLAFFGLTHPISTMIVAIIGSSIAAVFVYVIGSIGQGGPTPLKLALAGAATTAAISSLVSAIILPRARVMDTFRFWQIGGVGGAEWLPIGMATPFLIVGFGLCLISASKLNALALGDDVAASLGTNVVRARIVSSFGALILCGTATALAGPIGFVGLIVPHICRLLVGTDHRWLLPLSAVSGAILLLGADTLGRVVTRPSEIAVGILTPLIGGPLFIWIVRRFKVREL